MKSKPLPKSGVTTQNSSRRDVFSRIRRSVVAIVKAPPIVPGQPFDLKQIFIAGSGFYVDKSGLVITAGHVVDKLVAAIQQSQATGTVPEMPQVLAHGPIQQSGNTVSWGYFLSPVASIFRPTAFDLAVLRTNVDGDAAKAICAVEFATSQCAEGDHVATCGYPFGMELHAQITGGIPTIVPSFSQGVVSALLPHHAIPAAGQKRFQIHAMISGGNSGGPVFDPYSGRVVGVITDSLNSKYEGVVTRQTPKNATGAPIGAPVEKIIDMEFPIGLALAEHSHHVSTVLAEMKLAEAKQGAP